MIASALFLLLNQEAQTSAQIYNVVDDQPAFAERMFRLACREAESISSADLENPSNPANAATPTNV